MFIKKKLSQHVKIHLSEPHMDWVWMLFFSMLLKILFLLRRDFKPFKWQSNVPRAFSKPGHGAKEYVLYGTKQHRTSVIFLVLRDTLGTRLISTVFFVFHSQNFYLTHIVIKSSHIVLAVFRRDKFYQYMTV